MIIIKTTKKKSYKLHGFIIWQVWKHSNFHDLSHDMIEQGARKCAKREMFNDPLSALASGIGSEFISMLQSDERLQEFLEITPSKTTHKRRIMSISANHQSFTISHDCKQMILTCIVTFGLPALIGTMDIVSARHVDHTQLSDAFKNRYITSIME
jgi:hypothetical protein